MKRIIMLLFWVPVLAFGHGGEDHGQSKQATAAASYFAAEAVSGRYELLLKHGPIIPSQEVTLLLYISDYDSNAPMDSTELKVTVAGRPDIPLQVTNQEPGIYQLTAVFPERGDYRLIVSLNGKAGPDLIQVNGVKVGAALPGSLPEANEREATPASWLFGVGGLVTGVFFTFLLSRRRHPGFTGMVLVLACFFPATSFHAVEAHEGHTPQAGTMAAGSFRMEKETQFLYGILTQRVTAGAFQEAVPLFGTVVGAPDGMAVIQSPFTGSILHVGVRPGDRVRKGQVVAHVEQQIAAEDQMALETERNQVEAEYAAASIHLDRLLRIADIVAQKELSEAKARLSAAEMNRRLHQRNRGSSGAKVLFLKSPIDGVVSPFSYAPGAMVRAGEPLFEVTSLQKVYVEAQLPALDEQRFRQATTYLTDHPAGKGSPFQLRLLGAAQTVHSENQSRRLVFEVLNPDSQLKLGENLMLQAVMPAAASQISVPREAITQVGGREAVFVKDHAEFVRLCYILKGPENGKETVILKGLAEGERLIVSNVYQVKTIYLNQ